MFYPLSEKPANHDDFSFLLFLFSCVCPTPSTSSFVCCVVWFSRCLHPAWSVSIIRKCHRTSSSLLSCVSPLCINLLHCVRCVFAFVCLLSPPFFPAADRQDRLVSSRHGGTAEGWQPNRRWPIQGSTMSRASLCSVFLFFYISVRVFD